MFTIFSCNKAQDSFNSKSIGLNNLAVEKSSYKAIIPKNLKFRYLERNTSLKATISSDTENNIFYWEAKNLKALEWEPYSLSDQELFPGVIAAPADFEIDG